METPPESRHRRVLTLARRHVVLLVVLATAIALRVAFLAVYPYAFFFSDSRPYIAASYEWIPYTVRPFGYSAVLKPFVGHPYAFIALVQHIAALALLVAAYAFLIRRGARPWIAALAVLPFAIDAREITLEHYVLAETLFIVCTAAGLFLLTWRESLGWKAALGGGILLGYAAVTRSVGLPVLVLVGLYLLIRRVGLVRLVAFALPAIAILGSYMVWYHQEHGVYGFGQYQGRFLYARVMPIADCDKLELTEKQKTLCMPDKPEIWTQRPDQFIWNPASPAHKLYRYEDSDPFLNEFAKTVIKQRPLAYAGMVAEQTSWHLLPWLDLNFRAECLANQWIPPAQPGGDCQARRYVRTSSPIDVPAFNDPAPSAGTRFWHAYGKVVTPGPLYAIGVLLALFAAVYRRRQWRTALDALLFVGTGFGLIFLSVATSMFEYRYALPAVLLIPLGIALAVTHLTNRGASEECPPTSNSPSSSPA